MDGIAKTKDRGVKFPGVNRVHKVLADGSVRYYYYHRDTGTRLDGYPGATEFITSYAGRKEAP